MLDETGSEAARSPEEIIAECRESIQQMIEISGFQESVETAGQFGEVIDDQNWDQRVETEIKKLESADQQVRAEINFKLVEALFFLNGNQFDRCVGALETASDNAYNQSPIGGFEDLETLSDDIDKIIKRLHRIEQKD